MELQGFHDDNYLRSLLNDGRITPLQLFLHSNSLSNEFCGFCKDLSIPISEESALAFLDHINDEECDGHIEGID